MNYEVEALAREIFIRLASAGGTDSNGEWSWVGFPDNELAHDAFMKAEAFYKQRDRRYPALPLAPPLKLK